MVPADFNSTLRYHGAADPASLLTDLKALHEQSEWAKTIRWVLVAFLTGLIIGGFINGVLLGHGAVFYVGIPCAIVGYIVYWIIDSRYARLVLDERRLKLAAKAVRALACDLPADGKLELAVQFGPYNEPRFRTFDIPATTYNAAAYRMPWLSVRGTLADGTKVALTTDLIARRKERSKTKGRKKIKEDLCEHVALTLRPTSLPALTEVRWPDLVRRCPLPLTMVVHRAVVKEGRVVLELRTSRQVRVTDKGSVLTGKDAEERLCDGHGILMPMLAAYRALDSVRAGRA